MKARLLVLVAVAVLAAAAGYFLARFLQPGGEPSQSGPELTAEGQVLKPQDLIGQARPDFSHRESSGKQVSASDFDGQPLLLNFWATWCKPCVKELPHLNEMAAEFAGQVTVMAVNTDNSKSVAKVDQVLQFNMREMSLDDKVGKERDTPIAEAGIEWIATDEEIPIVDGSFRLLNQEGGLAGYWDISGTIEGDTASGDATVGAIPDGTCAGSWTASPTP